MIRHDASSRIFAYVSSSVMASAFSSNVEPFHKIAASRFTSPTSMSRCAFRNAETRALSRGTRTPRTGTVEPKYDWASGLGRGGAAAFSWATNVRRLEVASNAIVARPAGRKKVVVGREPRTAGPPLAPCRLTAEGVRDRLRVYGIAEGA